MDVTVVTGASRGIGAACAQRLAARGHAVAVNYRADGESAAKLVAEVTAAGGRATAIQADVTKHQDVEHLFAVARAELGRDHRIGQQRRRHGSHRRSGGHATGRHSSRHRPQPVRRNPVRAGSCHRHVDRPWRTRGLIVNISSAAATLGSPHEYVHYAAAKAGIDALTVGLSKELAGDGIRVNAVAPGLIRTTIHADAGDPERLERARQRVPLGHAGEVADVAGPVDWLFSDDAGYVSRGGHQSRRRPLSHGIQVNRLLMALKRHQRAIAADEALGRSGRRSTRSCSLDSALQRLISDAQFVLIPNRPGRRRASSSMSCAGGVLPRDAREQRAHGALAQATGPHAEAVSDVVRPAGNSPPHRVDRRSPPVRTPPAAAPAARPTQPYGDGANARRAVVPATTAARPSAPHPAPPAVAQAMRRGLHPPWARRHRAAAGATAMRSRRLPKHRPSERRRQPAGPMQQVPVR